MAGPAVPETSHQFHLHFLKLLLLLSAKVVPVNQTREPLSASVNILLPAYTVATAAISCLLSCGQPILLGCSADPTSVPQFPSIINVHQIP